MFKKTFLLLASLGFLLGFTQTARACFCGYRPVEDAFASAEIVFVGKVIRISSAKRATVGFVVKESGTFEVRKTPRLEKSFDKARIVTLEVTEAFKGVSSKTIDILSDVYNGGGNCAVNFKRGESYLVFAHPRQPLYVDENLKVDQQSRADEIRMKDEANKFNEKLPSLTTNICVRTQFSRFATAEVEKVRALTRERVLNKSAALSHF